MAASEHLLVVRERGWVHLQAAKVPMTSPNVESCLGSVFLVHGVWLYEPPWLLGEPEPDE